MIDRGDFIIKVENHKSSRRIYRMYCNTCNADRGYQRLVRHGLGLCKVCVSSFVHKDKKVTNITRTKMRNSHWLKSASAKHPMLGKHHSDAAKNKLSIATIEQNRHYKSKHKYEGPMGIHFMKSRWELGYALFLDGEGIQWQYEPRFALKNGRAFLPDFQLSNGDIIEIKGYFRPDAMLKWSMFCLEYPELKKRLLFKNDLKALGVIKS